MIPDGAQHYNHRSNATSNNNITTDYDYQDNINNNKHSPVIDSKSDDSDDDNDDNAQHAFNIYKELGIHVQTNGVLDDVEMLVRRGYTREEAVSIFAKASLENSKIAANSLSSTTNNNNSNNYNNNSGNNSSSAVVRERVEMKSESIDEYLLHNNNPKTHKVVLILNVVVVVVVVLHVTSLMQQESVFLASSNGHSFGATTMTIGDSTYAVERRSHGRRVGGLQLLLLSIA